MNATSFSNLSERVRRLPSGTAGRSRSLLRLTDEYAASEAAAALRDTADRAGTAAGVLADVLAAARELWPGRPMDAVPLTDEAVLRDRLIAAVESPEFLSLLPAWIRELREVASSRPGTGACTLATAFQLWAWTMNHFRTGDGAAVATSWQAVDELAEAICPLLAARCLTLEIASDTGATPLDPELRSDLCHVQAAHAAARAGAACAELVFGYRRHLKWDSEGCASCYGADELEALEAWMPGIASGARAHGDVIEADGTHPAKAGPCARFDGVDSFTRLRTRLDGCLTGSRLARDRAAAALERFAVDTATPRASEGSAR